MPLPQCPMCSRWEDDSDLAIIELRHSRVVLNRDQFFPGYCLLFTKEHVTELFHLTSGVRGELIEEVSRVAQALSKVFKADKINYELLGNMVPHMHWHIVPRFKGDPLWPRPIWAESHDEVFLAPEENSSCIDLIRKALS
ncbi:HIT family protein [Pelotalea chapellei]|uniref:HIT family protein n=1 Tax=Pelotalea chapellei TaxID=44671 RepID=A0ABS5UC68_9BACT|nr:HIT family protein [Pelotalea chapellei]MBT1073290.1 HIT family protein [Pelotalea chapellei]